MMLNTQWYITVSYRRTRYVGLISLLEMLFSETSILCSELFLHDYHTNVAELLVLCVC